jgi:hypothetical protein
MQLPKTFVSGGRRFFEIKFKENVRRNTLLKQGTKEYNNFCQAIQP